MDTIVNIPIWGQYGILGFFIGCTIFFATQYFRGEWVNRKQLEDEQKVSNSWREAWGVSQQTNHDTAQLLSQMIITSQTMEKVLKALPPLGPEVVETRSEGDDE